MQHQLTCVLDTRFAVGVVHDPCYTLDSNAALAHAEANPMPVQGKRLCMHHA